MTDCISLIQLVRFLNQTIYKLGHSMESPTTRALSFHCPLVQLHAEQMSDPLFCFSFSVADNVPAAAAQKHVTFNMSKHLQVTQVEMPEQRNLGQLP